MSLARRNLFHDKTRLALSISGVALAVILILVLKGFLTGMNRQIIKDGSWPMSFPFNPPGYRALYVPTKGGLGFNVIRCPVAEYFHARGATDLAVSTWCMLDYPLAEMVGMKLVRTQTLAAGDPQCDFRWFTVVKKL